MLKYAIAPLFAGLALSLAPQGLAAGQGEEGEARLSVAYEGQRYFLVRALEGDELEELLSGNTMMFIHPNGLEVEFHRENGQTANGWAEQDEAKSGFWQVEGDEVCWTYNSGTHCKPMWTTEREDLYAQVPGWYDGPLGALWEQGDSRNMMDRPVSGNAI